MDESIEHDGMIGQSVSHYRILGRLGTGGMGEVYSAEDKHLGRQVAIKFPTLPELGGQFNRRFEYEARAASRLTHPNIARVYDYGESPDGRPFLVMELVRGRSLKDVVREGRLEPARARAIITGVLRALQEAHANDLVHRDIKPANVMLDSASEVKVLDFGLAKHLPVIAAENEITTSAETVTFADGLTEPGGVPGTPDYMSPEQARGESVDARSDLFSVGVLLYRCLTGAAPFTGRSSRDVLNNILTTEPPAVSAHVPDLDKRWDRIVGKALEKDAARRYQSAAEMLADVQRLGPARDEALSRRVAGFLFGTTQRAVLTAVIGVALAAGAIQLVRGRAPHEPGAEAAGWYQRGAVALRDGTYYAAARLLQRAVDADPDFALAHARLAEAANELDDRTRANAEMLAALPTGSEAAPRGTAAKYIDAIHRTLTGDFAGAVTRYQELADTLTGVEGSAALVDLGRAFEKGNQVNKAIEAYRNALKRDDDNAAAHLRLGILLGRLRDAKYAGHLDRAFALYQALSNTEGQAEVLYQRGLLLTSVDRPAARIALERSRDMARAIPSEAQEIAAILQLATVAYLSGDLSVADGTAADAVARAQRGGLNYLAARGLANRGDVQRLKLDWPGAEASYRESLAVSQRHRMLRTEARALFGLANVHQTAGPIEAAVKEAEAALAYYKGAGFQIETVQCLLVLARAHRDLGHGAEAVKTFEQALEAAKKAADPANAVTAQQGLATVLMYYGRWPEALTAYEHARQAAAALNDAANVVRGEAGRGAILFRLGRYGDAKDAFENAGRTAETVAASARPSLENTLLYRRAEMALSRNLYTEAAALARQAFASPGANPQTAQSAKCLAAAAMARIGQAAAGRQLCEPALAALVSAGDRFAVTDARLRLAAILLAQRDTAAALEAARLVAEEAAAVGNPETEWRAWALRARILRQRGDADGAAQSVRKATDLFRGLSWDADNLRSYAERPDVALLRQELQASR